MPSTYTASSSNAWDKPKATAPFTCASTIAGSTYLTFKKDRKVIAAQDDAGSFVASNGSIRGPYLESAMQQVRADNPNLKVSDMELANAILVKNATAE